VAFSAMARSFSFALAISARVAHWLDLITGSLDDTRWVIHAAPVVA
jgi:hypothetical protein